jgi:hypothetical protein
MSFSPEWSTGWKEWWASWERKPNKWPKALQWRALNPIQTELFPYIIRRNLLYGSAQITPASTVNIDIDSFGSP